MSLWRIVTPWEGGRPLHRLLPTVTKDGQAPRMANLALQLWSFGPIEETLSDCGYVTEKLEDRTFRQRRFVSDEEREQVLEQLRERGIDPSGKEAEGHSAHGVLSLTASRRCRAGAPDEASGAEGSLSFATTSPSRSSGPGPGEGGRGEVDPLAVPARRDRGESSQRAGEG